ncbi:DUF3006 domain-containing protein [bacterium]|nr:DUF3006 domain-containing protein [bacterium]
MIITGVCDRFEEKIAVIVLDRGGEMYIPITLLPKDLKEGDVLNFDVSIDKKKTKKRFTEMEKMRQDLLDKNKKAKS